jgi:hypothetical protein
MSRIKAELMLLTTKTFTINRIDLGSNALP